VAYQAKHVCCSVLSPKGAFDVSPGQRPVDKERKEEKTQRGGTKSKHDKENLRWEKITGRFVPPRWGWKK